LDLFGSAGSGGSSYQEKEVGGVAPGKAQGVERGPNSEQQRKKAGREREEGMGQCSSSGIGGTYQLKKRKVVLDDDPDSVPEDSSSQSSWIGE